MNVVRILDSVDVNLNVGNILFSGWALRYSHAIKLTLFLWHMPADTIETVAEHSTRLQPSINLHAPVTAFMFSCSGTQCTTLEG